MGKLTIASAAVVLTVGMGAANAGETPEILGAADYQAMSKLEMSSITGETTRINIRNRNNNTNVNYNTNVQQQFQCAALCAGGDLVTITL